MYNSKSSSNQDYHGISKNTCTFLLLKAEKVPGDCGKYGISNDAHVRWNCSSRTAIVKWTSKWTCNLLNLNDCNNLSRFPSTINGLKSLKTLYLFGFSNLGNVPKNLMKIESLEELDLSGTAVRQPVLSIFLLKNLKEYIFMDAKRKDLQHLGICTSLKCWGQEEFQILRL